MSPAFPLFLAVLAAVAASAAGPARAERADRNKPMVVEADRSGTVDLQRQVLVYAGNVVISQGSMILRAERIEMRELPDGYRAASATGVAGKPASWRQKRDGVDETVEGSADRIEFDGRADTLRFVGNGAVRRLRGGAVADEITGAVILWDNIAEVFKVEGGVATAVNPTGRVRAVLSPRVQADAAAPAASAPGLAPSRALGDRR
jgi:lipopolysaccharide export system protein LptA